MALTKEVIEDKIEVVGDLRHVQIRKATVVKEDGKELSRSFVRRVLDAGKRDASDNFVDTDTSSESAEVKAIAAGVWTQEVKDKLKAHLIALKTP